MIFILYVCEMFFTFIIYFENPNKLANNHHIFKLALTNHLCLSWISKPSFDQHLRNSYDPSLMPRQIKTMSNGIWYPFSIITLILQPRNCPHTSLEIVHSSNQIFTFQSVEHYFISEYSIEKSESIHLQNVDLKLMIGIIFGLLLLLSNNHAISVVDRPRFIKVLGIHLNIPSIYYG